MQSPPETFEVASVADAARVLAYFNAFHDGFVRRLVVTSRDEIAEDLSQTCTGLFDVDLELAHYNYPAVGRPPEPHGRRVHARFEGVREPLFDFAEGYVGNTIIALDIVAAVRRPFDAEDDQPCLALELTRSFLVQPPGHWESRRLRILTFERATFRESNA